MSRAVLRSVLELRTPFTRLPPTFLLPIRRRLFNSTASIIEPAQPDDTVNGPQSSPLSSGLSSSPSASAPSTAASPSPTPSESVRALLPLLAAQPSRYITIHIHGKPYLVTAGDSVRLPFKIPGVLPGDVLRLNRATVLGSRDFSLKGSPYIDEGLFECRAVVLGAESEPMRLKIKKKRRNRRKKTVRSKDRYTILRIQELTICNPAA